MNKRRTRRMGKTRKMRKVRQSRKNSRRRMKRTRARKGGVFEWFKQKWADAATRRSKRAKCLVEPVQSEHEDARPVQSEHEDARPLRSEHEDACRELLESNDKKESTLTPMERHDVDVYWRKHRYGNLADEAAHATVKARVAEEKVISLLKNNNFTTEEITPSITEIDGVIAYIEDKSQLKGKFTDVIQEEEKREITFAQKILDLKKIKALLMYSNEKNSGVTKREPGEIAVLEKVRGQLLARRPI